MRKNTRSYYCVARDVIDPVVTRLRRTKERGVAKVTVSGVTSQRSRGGVASGDKGRRNSKEWGQGTPNKGTAKTKRTKERIQQRSSETKSTKGASEQRSSETKSTKGALEQ